MSETHPAWTPAWLVWVQGPKGPCPQIWFDDGGRCVGPRSLIVIERHEIPLGAKRDLDVLVELYPLTQQEAA